MSVIGYEQHVCANGHYWEIDALIGIAYAGLIKCPFCKKPSVWYNMVDTTNGIETGRIDMSIYLIRPKRIIECTHGQHTEPAVYQIPPMKQTANGFDFTW